MDIVKYIIYPIIVSIFSAAIIPEIVHKIKKKRNIKNETPLVLTYNLTNPNTQQEFVDELLKCNYMYILTCKRITPFESNGVSVHTELQFERTNDTEKIKAFVNENYAFGICFHNKIENSVLSISCVTLNDGSFCFICDDTMLSALKFDSSVCFICSISDVPKDFSGSFQERSITYRISDKTTTQIVPVYKSTY